MAIGLSSCGKSKFSSKTTHPDGTVTEWGGSLTGNYGLIPKHQTRGNQGDGGGGGLLGAILPGFDYSDAETREFYEARQNTYVRLGPDGITITGPVDHGTTTSIGGDAINRGVRNVATMAGWMATLDAAEAIHAANEATTRKVDTNATKKAVRADDNATKVRLKQIRVDSRGE